MHSGALGRKKRLAKDRKPNPKWSGQADGRSEGVAE